MDQIATGQRGRALMRLRGMVRKEWLQILRDPSSLAIAFVMPVVLLSVVIPNSVYGPPLVVATYTR